MCHVKARYHGTKQPDRNCCCVNEINTTAEQRSQEAVRKVALTTLQFISSPQTGPLTHSDNTRVTAAGSKRASVSLAEGKVEKKAHIQAGHLAWYGLRDMGALLSSSASCPEGDRQKMAKNQARPPGPEMIAVSLHLRST